MPGGKCGLFPGTAGARGSRGDPKDQATNLALYEIRQERVRQDKKWGFPQTNTYCEWAAILAEECGELAKEMNELNSGRGDRERMRDEATQVAAVALSILIHDDLNAIEPITQKINEIRHTPVCPRCKSRRLIPAGDGEFTCGDCGWAGGGVK